MVLVLKKKDLSLLHVFHHFIMAPLPWLWLAYGNWTIIWIGGALNTVVHTFMYGYYFLAVLIPGWRPWWKKYLTSTSPRRFAAVVDFVFVSLFRFVSVRCFVSLFRFVAFRFVRFVWCYFHPPLSRE